jgi:hypothetical protein
MRMVSSGSHAAHAEILRIIQVERKHFPQKLPMLVIGGSGNPARRSQQVLLPAIVDIVQIPYRALSE